MTTAGDALRAGDIAGALAAATAAVKAAPTDADARWLMAELLLLTGEVERADRMLDAAALRDPNPRRPPAVRPGVRTHHLRNPARAGDAVRHVTRDLEAVSDALLPYYDRELAALGKLWPASSQRRTPASRAGCASRATTSTIRMSSACCRG